MKRSIILLAALFAASPAAAGYADGKPVGITVSEYNVVFFTVVGNRSNPPTNCPATLIPNRFAIPSTTDAGRAMISLLLTAQARGKIVYINGTGNCNTWGDSEGVNYIESQD